VVPGAPGFRLRAQTPARRLKFESHLSARIIVIPVAAGFRLRARTPAKRLKFESHPSVIFEQL